MEWTLKKLAYTFLTPTPKKNSTILKRLLHHCIYKSVEIYLVTFIITSEIGISRNGPLLRRVQIHVNKHVRARITDAILLKMPDHRECLHYIIMHTCIFYIT